MTICSELIAIVEQHLPAILGNRRAKHLKPDGSYVTQADLLIQELVAAYIASHCEEHVLISEEQDNSAFDAARESNYIVVDPLDGTENFASGLKEWGVGISVFERNRHVESAIFLPELGDRLLTGDAVERFESRIHGLSSSLLKEDLQSIEPGLEYRIMGCSMYNMFNVIRGSYRVFQNVKGVNTWDILPGINLALEHGCHVWVNGEAYDGQFLVPNIKYRVKIRHG